MFVMHHVLIASIYSRYTRFAHYLLSLEITTKAISMKKYLDCFHKHVLITILRFTFAYVIPTDNVHRDFWMIIIRYT